MDNKLSLHPSQESKQPWYSEGLHFSCTGCGGCCTGAPGYTWVSPEEIASIAAYLKMSTAEFSRRYLRRVGDRYSLTELRPHYDCVFLEGKRCKIYSVRPTQCRTFPFWPESLSSPESWKETARRCEGIQPEACLVPRAEIEQQLRAQEERGS